MMSAPTNQLNSAALGSSTGARRALRSCANFGAGPTKSGSTRAVRKGGHCWLHGNGRPYQSRLAARPDAGAPRCFLFLGVPARGRA